MKQTPLCFVILYTGFYLCTDFYNPFNISYSCMPNKLNWPYSVWFMYYSIEDQSLYENIAGRLEGANNTKISCTSSEVMLHFSVNVEDSIMGFCDF